MAVLEAEVQAVQAGVAVEPAELVSEYLYALRRLSLDDYHWLIERGYFERNGLVAARVELIDEYLIDMSPNHPPHASTITRLDEVLHVLVVIDNPNFQPLRHAVHGALTRDAALRTARGRRVKKISSMSVGQ